MLYLSIHFEIDLPKPLVPLSNSLQKKCSEFLSHPTNPDDLSRSFICGSKVSQAQHKTWLQKSGVYHAIVVSGGHFLFLEAIMKRVSLPAGIRFLILMLYYLITGLQAPGLRCLTQMGVNSGCQKFNLNMSDSTLCFYSGIICLIISFPLWNSLSFWLSFSVSMSLCFSSDFLSRSPRSAQILISLFFIYVFLLPFNFTSGYLHPLNLILGALLLMPFCFVLLFSALLVTSARIFDLNIFFTLSAQLNSWLFTILKKWTLLVPDKNNGEMNLFAFWIYILILIAFLHLVVVYFRRETIHE